MKRICFLLCTSCPPLCAYRLYLLQWSRRGGACDHSREANLNRLIAEVEYGVPADEVHGRWSHTRRSRPRWEIRYTIMPHRGFRRHTCATRPGGRERKMEPSELW